jgi:hypothetical protein
MSEPVSTARSQLLIQGFHDALSPPHLGKDGAYHPVPLYGDGSPINLEDLDQAANIVNETRSLVKWEEGDVLILDVSSSIEQSG